MIIKDDKLLASFRGPGKCELCGRECKACEAHHAVYCRGMGGGSRLDIMPNLIRCGSTQARECSCHTEIQEAGKAGRERCIEVIAKREKCEASDVEECVKFFKNIPKGMTEVCIRDEARRTIESHRAWELALEVITAMPDQSPKPRPLKKRRKKVKK